MSKNNMVFAIESFISNAYANRGIMAIGYFLIKINGISYGVKEYNATALACSYDEVIRRLEMRGKHIAPAELSVLPGLELAQLANDILYGDIDNDQDDCKISMSHDELIKVMYKRNLVWSPDGDEAFDDGSRVLQFDIDNETVRLIGFKTTSDDKVDISTLTDLIMDSNEFYLVLKKWADDFYKEWSCRAEADELS
jgi:hypothetical protein